MPHLKFLNIRQDRRIEKLVLALMQAIADLTSAALERRRLNLSEEVTLQEREMLYLASRSINSASTFKEIFEDVRHIEFNGGHHYLYRFEDYDVRHASYIETVATSSDTIMIEGSRKSQLGGALIINSSPGHGTHITVQLPNCESLTSAQQLY